MSGAYEREFEFTRKDFEFIRDLVGERTGIVLSDHKVDMVYGRLARRLRQLKISSFRDYLSRLGADDDQELVEFTNALTTNLTAFFREPHHFEYLAQRALPRLIASRPQRRLRLWSAGCSTGEEPYSIAMTLHEALPQLSRWDVRLLATDLDSSVVDKARAGIYDESRVNGVANQRVTQWFARGRGSNEGRLRVSPRLRELITFKQLNLMHQWPMKGPFDVIFCRNVIIYFNKETQRLLFERFADLLADDGYLFVGHSETLHKVTDRFKLIEKTIYEKVV